MYTQVFFKKAQEPDLADNGALYIHGSSITIPSSFGRPPPYLPACRSVRSDSRYITHLQTPTLTHPHKQIKGTLAHLDTLPKYGLSKAVWTHDVYGHSCPTLDTLPNYGLSKAVWTHDVWPFLPHPGYPAELWPE